jgi:hypothetical protein
MKNTPNSEITAGMVQSASELQIISGEGEVGTVEMYRGARTARAVKARLTRERCGGDRWAVLVVDGERI